MENKKDKSIKEHIILVLIFLMMGCGAVFARRFFSGGQVLDSITNMLGTLTWAGLITILMSALFYRSRYWKIFTPVVSIVFCLIMELLQLTVVPGIISKTIPMARLVFGATYAWSDLPWYFVGVLFAWFALQSVKNKQKRFTLLKSQNQKLYCEKDSKH